MKKLTLITILIFTILPCWSLAQYVDFGTSVCSGFIFHSNNDEAKTQPLLEDPTANRILVGLNADATFNTSPIIKIFAGSDIFCDFSYKQKFFYNTFDYAFFGGIKLFPHLAGLNISASYVIGNRTDFIKTEDIRQNKVFKWGNGFRLGLEYDFLYERESKICPCVGMYYRYMPRGDYRYDNLLTAYVGLRF